MSLLYQVRLVYCLFTILNSFRDHFSKSCHFFWARSNGLISPLLIEYYLMLSLGLNKNHPQKCSPMCPLQSSSTAKCLACHPAFLYSFTRFSYYSSFWICTATTLSPVELWVQLDKQPSSRNTISQDLVSGWLVLERIFARSAAI